MKGMNDKNLSAALVAIALACAAGCGQKGPLYLPEPAKDVVTRPVATPPPASETAAPEVTPADKSKKDKNGATTPPPK